MTSIKVKTADVALAVAGGALAVAAAWRPGVVPAWFALVPIGLLVLGVLVLVPYQVLVAHEGWKATRQARLTTALPKALLANRGTTGPENREEPTAEVAQ